MQFTVPQFIEREPKIWGPFTFKEFIFIGLAIGFSILLYFTIKSFTLFLILATLIGVTAFSLALIKPGGRPLPTILINFLFFLFKPKIYLWGRKTLSVRVPPPKIKPEKEIKEKSLLKITERSHLRELFNLLETKTK